jgi:hypothetical protein
VSLEFGDGATLSDEYKVLEGEGKLRRPHGLTAWWLQWTETP